MLNTSKKEKTSLRRLPAKIVQMEREPNALKKNDHSVEHGTDNKNNKCSNIKFCEPVFKPKKHEFL